MSLQNYQARIIALLGQQEMLVSELYKLFGGLFPNNREFWNGLSLEELEHATWVEYLYKKAQDGDVHFNDQKLKTYTVESFVRYLEDAIAKVRDRAPTQQAAFSLALNIEKSLLVKNLFDHFQGNTADLSNLLRDLRAKTADHRGRIEAKAASLTCPRGV